LGNLWGNLCDNLFFDRRTDAITGNRNHRIVSHATANEGGGMG
jgi:hypothetical protein